MGIRKLKLGGYFFPDDVERKQHGKIVKRMMEGESQVEGECIFQNVPFYEQPSQYFSGNSVPALVVEKKLDSLRGKILKALKDPRKSFVWASDNLYIVHEK